MKSKTIWIILVSLLFGSLACKAGEDFYQVTASDRAFFKQVQKAVLAEDWEWLSAAVSYPIDIHLIKKTLHIKTKEEFKTQVRGVFHEHFKKIIRDQSEASLFKNWQGVMLGEGEIWFTDFEEAGQKEGQVTKTQRIIAINQIPDKSPPKE